MEKLVIKLKWHKSTDKHAATYSQLKYIEDLGGKIGGVSYTNAMRQMTIIDASEVINALKNNIEVEYN